MNLLTVKSKTNEQVVLEVKDLTLEEIALHPMFNKNMKYITVTRGKNHTMTIINKDGYTWSFDWGEGGYTLISDNLERLKQYVLKFLKENLILIDSRSDVITQGRTFYNDNFNAHQLTLNTKDEDVHLWFDTIEERQQYLNKLGLRYKETIPNPYVKEVNIYTY